MLIKVKKENLKSEKKLDNTTFELIKAIHEIDPSIDLKEFLFGEEE